MRFLALFFFAILVTPINAHSIKIGYIDVEKVINSLSQYEQENNALIQQFEPKKQQLLDLFKHIELLKKNLNNNETYQKDLDKIREQEDTKLLLELGDIWWWESNRLMPIDVFLHHELRPFRPFLSTFIMKDITHLFGPMTTLQNLLKKRIKRRGIQLIRKTD